MGGALAGTVVLDLSESVAGQYCCRLLADYGATVILVEPPDGSSLRRRGPFDPQSGESLLFFHLNTGKQSMTLDPEARGYPGKLEKLVERADVTVSDAALSDESQGHPRLVQTRITPFGDIGPYKGWRSCEMIQQALSGVMINNGSAGLPPLYGCGERASYAAGLAAYIGIVAALFERETSGLGQQVDIAIAEVAASMSTAVTAYNYSGRLDGGRGRSESLVNCRGEWVTLWVYPYQWKDFCTALGIEHLYDDERFASIEGRQRNWAELVALVQDKVKDQPADEVVARMQAHRLITAKAASLTSLMEDPHLAARGFWEHVASGGHNRLALGPPFRLSATPRGEVGSAPALNETS